MRKLMINTAWALMGTRIEGRRHHVGEIIMWVAWRYWPDYAVGA